MHILMPTLMNSYVPSTGIPCFSTLFPLPILHLNIVFLMLCNYFPVILAIINPCSSYLCLFMYLSIIGYTLILAFATVHIPYCCRNFMERNPHATFPH